MHQGLKAAPGSLFPHQGRPVQEEEPKSIPAFAVRPDDLLSVGHPAFAPGAQSQYVVRAHVLDADHFEAGRFRGAEHARERKARIGAGKDVAIHEQPPDQVFGFELECGEGVPRIVQVANPHPLKNEEPVFLQELVDLLEISRKVLDPDVLDHFEADDLLELADDVAIVADFHHGPLRDTVLRDPRVAELDLLSRERHPSCSDSVVTSGTSDECSPSAADIEQLFARLQLQLVAAAIDLRQLPEERQAEILDVAAAEFAKNGYQGTSYNQLLERLQLGKSSAYYYFEDKRDLFLTVAQHCYTVCFESMAKLERPRTVSGFWKFIHQASVLGFAFILQNPTAAKVVQCMQREQQLIDELSAFDFLDGMNDFHERVIREGQNLGAIRTDMPRVLLVRTARNLTVTFDQWFIAEHAHGGSAPSVEEAAKHLSDVLRRVLKK